VEDLAAKHFATFGTSTKTGSEIDDAGERADLTRVLLEGGHASALHWFNPKLPREEVEQTGPKMGRSSFATCEFCAALGR
jgi:hypothetical protein